jgi:hypothetical protein
MATALLRHASSMVVHADTAGLITQTAGHRFAASIQGGVAANRSALVGHDRRLSKCEGQNNPEVFMNEPGNL